VTKLANLVFLVTKVAKMTEKVTFSGEI